MSVFDHPLSQDMLSGLNSVARYVWWWTLLIAMYACPWLKGDMRWSESTLCRSRPCA